MKKGPFILVGIMMLSIVVNFFPSIKYPDVVSDNTWIHVMSSSAVLFAILFVSDKMKKVIFLSSAMMGILIFMINLTAIRNLRPEYIVLDLIFAIEYPLFILVITPFFGFLQVLSISYENFALVIAFVCSALLLLVKLKSMRFPSFHDM